MMITSLFLPIKSMNLAHYFMKGCVCPTLYLNNRNDDIQSIVDDFLLFTTEKFTVDTNCALEIVLTKDDEQYLQQYSTDFYLFSKPLPISRVKKVIFLNDESCKNTCFNIENGVAFLPKELIHVEQSLAPSKVIKKIPFILDEYRNENKKWHSEIDRFNRILGGFAMMQTTSIDVEDYPLNYFYSLSLFNKNIKRDFEKIKFESSNDYQWIFERNSEKTNFPRFHEYIYKKIERSTVESAALHDNVNLQESLGKYALDKIDPSTTTYTLAILASYDVSGARMTLDNFISDLMANKFPSKKREPLALTFGINKGYSAFRNSYKTNNTDVNVKYKLDSQLDYYTIESIYQFTFHDKSDCGTFDYIDDWCPKFKSNDKYDNYETGIILDKKVKFKKKEKKELFFKSIFQNVSRHGIYKRISTEIAKWAPPYLNSNSEACINHFRKLLEASFEQYTSDIYDEVKNKLEAESNYEFMKQNVEIGQLKETRDLQQKEINKLKCENKRLKGIELNKNGCSDMVSDEKHIVGLHKLTDRELREHELNKKTVKQLVSLAKDRKIPSSKLKKRELIKKILTLEFN